MLENYKYIQIPICRVYFAEGEDHFARICLDEIEKRFPKIAEYFEIDGLLRTESSEIDINLNDEKLFPQIRIVLVPDRAEFDRLVRDMLRIEIEYPSHPARIAQPQREDMILLSPPAYKDHSIFDYVEEEFRMMAIHESIHIVDEFLSPDIEKSPGWWGEGLAVYLSRQSQFDASFRNPALDAIKHSKMPSFNEIQEERKLYYYWGWTIVQYIENKYGREKILEIVNECANGDVISFLNDNDFEKNWHSWIIENLSE